MSYNQSDYQYLIDEFSAEKISSRYSYIENLISDFINKEEIADKVVIDENNLNHMVMDYFADICRLKQFHNIERINEDKITSYTIYWLLKRRVIQVTEDFEESTFINEKLVLSILQSYLLREDYAKIVPREHKINTDAFYKNFFYSCKYRNIDQQMLELLIIAYRAGRSFQYAMDISNKDITEKPINSSDVEL